MTKQQDHSDSSAETARLQWDEPPEEIAKPPGSKLGRYVVVEAVGAGGMGVVYAAFDPRLERKVAVKVLRDGALATPNASERMRREGETLAQLSHPNVVEVFDVGDSDGKTFIAMEFVDGETLKQWLATVERSWRSVVEVFVGCGRGLAAAHAAGIVHRDFKPGNVLVGGDARPRVTDFGLATVDGSDSHSPLSTPSSSSGSSRPRPALTEAGVVLGTPAYMAPEQHRGQPADAQSDQFSFCVALWEALFGERPFAGETTTEVGLAKHRGVIAEPNSDGKVPGWLVRVVKRGLATEPGSRWPSMETLLDALERRRRRRPFMALALAVAGMGVVAGVWHEVRQPPVCTGADQRIAEVWGPGKRARTRDAFRATTSSVAEESWQTVARALDDHLQRWANVHRASCETARAGGPPSDLDLTMECLRRGLREVEALVDVFSHADATLVGRGSQSVASLASADRCGDVVALRARLPPPTDPTARAAVDAVRTQLARAAALSHAGRYRPGLKVGTEALAAARQLGHAPVEAEALFRMSHLHEQLGNHDAAESDLVDAIHLAKAVGHDELAADALIDLVFLIGYQQARPKDAARWWRHAEAAVARLGWPTDDTARLLHNRAIVAEGEGQYAEAAAHYRRAIELFERMPGEGDLRLASALGNLGQLALELGDADEARTYQERALAILERRLGSRHPQVADALNTMGMMADAQGRRDESRRFHARAIAIQAEVLGPDHPDVGISLHNLGTDAARNERYGQARAYLERALVIFERAYGPDHPHVATLLDNLGNVTGHLGRVPLARALHERAIEIVEHTFGPDHPDLATPLGNLALMLEDLGELDRAMECYERAARVRESVGGPSHPDLGYALTGMGAILLRQGRPHRAAAVLGRAVAVRDAPAADPELVGESRFLLGRALWETGDRNRARQLVLEARADYSRSGGDATEELAEINAWLRRVGS